MGWGEKVGVGGRWGGGGEGASTGHPQNPTGSLLNVARTPKQHVCLERPVLPASQVHQLFRLGPSEAPGVGG